MFAPAYNPTDHPVLIDARGRTLGGGDWGVVWRTGSHVVAAVDRDDLVVLSDAMVPKDLSAAAADARDAIEAARAAQEAHDDLEGLDKDVLVAALERVDVEHPAELAELHKPELVRELALAGVSVAEVRGPAPSSTTPTTDDDDAAAGDPPTVPPAKKAAAAKAAGRR